MKLMRLFVVLAALLGAAVLLAGESSARERSSRLLPRDGPLTFIRRYDARRDPGRDRPAREASDGLVVSAQGLVR